jgi:hypothetical protein
MKRRRVIGLLLAAPFGYFVVRWGSHFAAVYRAAAWKRDARTLANDYADDVDAMALALLPSALSPDAVHAVAVDFFRWLESQDPTAELNHLGFLLTRDALSTRPPGAHRRPVGASNYLKEIDVLRRQIAPRRLSDLSREELRHLLTAFLVAAGARGIPAGPNGGSLSLDLLSFFYRSPEATDLFHERRIGAMTCRPLDSVGQSPPPVPAGFTG